MKTNQKSLKIGIFLVLALFSLVGILSFASACHINSFGCYDLIKFNPNLLIPTGTSFALDSHQGVVNVTKVDVKWGDSHSGCMGRVEYPGGNSSWKDVHTSEIEKFTFSSNLKININDIKIAIMPKNAKAVCKPVKVDWIYVRGACGNNTGNNTDPGNETNETVDTLAPIVTINSPNQSTYNASNVLFDFSVNDTDGSVDTTWFTLNGLRYEYTLPTTLTLVNGTYNLVAYANDTAGHTGNAGFNFTVLISGNNNNTNPGNETNSTNQTTVPTIIIHSPNNFSGTSNTFVINVTSDQTISQWFYSLNGGNLTSFTPLITVLNARNGSNTLFVQGINANNTAGNATKIFTFTYDSGNNDNNDDNEDVVDDDPVFVKKNNYLENDTVSVTKDNGVIKLLSSGNDSLMFRSAVYWLVLLVLALLILIVLVIIIRKLKGY